MLTATMNFPHLTVSLSRRIATRIKYQGFRLIKRNKQRVFVIGLSKTGTTSAVKALEILGFKTFHHPPCYELDSNLNLKFNWHWWLNKYDAFGDIPITLYLPKIDEMFPNAKFIQTIRDKESWLNSCRNYFTDSFMQSQPERNRILNQTMYGSDVFNAISYSRAYDCHHNFIDKYFHRRSDLIKLDVFKNEGWEKICPFLNIDTLDCAFPKKNVTYQN